MDLLSFGDAVDAAEASTHSWWSSGCLTVTASEEQTARVSNVTTGGIASWKIHGRLTHRIGLLSVWAPHPCWKFNRHELLPLLAWCCSIAGWIFHVSLGGEGHSSESKSLSKSCLTQLHHWQLHKTCYCRSNRCLNPEVLLSPPLEFSHIPSQDEAWSSKRQHKIVCVGAFCICHSHFSPGFQLLLSFSATLPFRKIELNHCRCNFFFVTSGPPIWTSIFSSLSRPQDA